MTRGECFPHPRREYVQRLSQGLVLRPDVILQLGLAAVTHDDAYIEDLLGTGGRGRSFQLVYEHVHLVPVDGLLGLGGGRGDEGGEEGRGKKIRRGTAGSGSGEAGEEEGEKESSWISSRYTIWNQIIASAVLMNELSIDRAQWLRRNRKDDAPRGLRVGLGASRRPGKTSHRPP